MEVCFVSTSPRNGRGLSGHGDHLAPELQRNPLLGGELEVPTGQSLGLQFGSSLISDTARNLVSQVWPRSNRSRNALATLIASNLVITLETTLVSKLKAVVAFLSLRRLPASVLSRSTTFGAAAPRWIAWI
jgi:hypothetical protein